MKLAPSIAAAAALLAALPAFAANTLIDFEGVTSFASVANYSNGGSDGAVHISLRSQQHLPRLGAGGGVPDCLRAGAAATVRRAAYPVRNVRAEGEGFGCAHGRSPARGGKGNKWIRSLCRKRPESTRSRVSRCR